MRLAAARATVVVVLGVVLAIPLLLWLLGFAPAPALHALWTGSFGSFYALTSGTLVRATPLVLTGLAVGVAFRAGVFNIGAEGQFLAGAACAGQERLAVDHRTARMAGGNDRLVVRELALDQP